MSDGRWLAVAALLALAGASKYRGSRGLARASRSMPARLIVRYIHKISPRATDVDAPIPLPDPELLFLDADRKTVDVAAVRGLWKKLHPSSPLGRLSQVRVGLEREPGDPVCILLFNPSLWSTQHAIVLEIHGWDEPSGSRGVARASRQTLPPSRYTYAVTYEERDADGDDLESGYVVGGWDTPLPEGLHGAAAARWRLENEVDQDLEPADEDDLSREAAHVDAEEIVMAKVSEGFRKAVAFGRLVRGAGATDDSGSDWWSTEPDQDMNTGGWRIDSYHPSNVLFERYGSLIRAVVKQDRSAVRAALEAVGALP